MNRNRPDLSAQQILALICTVIIIAVCLTLWPMVASPGSPAGQICATLGALLLLAPRAFLVMKRSGWSASPPHWFITHVIATSLGSCLVFIHVASGDWLSPPGIVLVLMLFLVLQGSLLRGMISRDSAPQ